MSKTCILSGCDPASGSAVELARSPVYLVYGLDIHYKQYIIGVGHLLIGSNMGMETVI